MRERSDRPGGFTFEFPEAVVDAIADRVADRLAAEFATGREAEGEPYWRVAQIAEYLAAPKSRVYQLLADGRLRCRYDGRTPLSKRSWVDAMLSEPDDAA